MKKEKGPVFHFRVGWGTGLAISMHSDPVLVRRAIPSDRDQILAFTQNTFSWGDYLSRVWDEWQQDEKGGRLLVAEVGGRTVGNLHVALIGNREGWMEGMRVHPDFRKQGVATALECEGQRLAALAGCSVSRLETASTNKAAQAAIATYGYKRRLALCGWNAKTKVGESARTRLANIRDAALLYALWSRSRMRVAMKGLTHLPGWWRWGQLTKPRLREAIEKGLVYVTPASKGPLGFVIIERDEEDVGIHLLVGRAEQASELIRDVQARAGQWGYKEIYMVLPDFPFAAKWAEAAGFTTEDHQMLIYECALRTSRPSR